MVVRFFSLQSMISPDVSSVLEYVITAFWYSDDMDICGIFHRVLSASMFTQAADFCF